MNIVMKIKSIHIKNIELSEKLEGRRQELNVLSIRRRGWMALRDGETEDDNER